MTLAHYDTLIVGGSIVGLTLANLLADSGLKIVIIEQQALGITALSENFELRVSAITKASQGLFQQLGIWQPIQCMRLAPYNRMFVWDAINQAHIEFNAADIGESTLGHIIENSVIQQALLAKVKNSPAIELVTNACLTQLKIASDHVMVKLDTGQALSASLLVGADGAHSKVRELAGIAINYQPYGQTAIVATVRCEKSHQQTARQCFLREGILAFLPLPDLQTCSLVWSSNTSTAERLLKLDDVAFNVALEDVFSQQLGKLELISKRQSFPLTMRHARHYVAPRVALAGDAAHTLHPLAGQGLNLGLADAAYLAEVILKTKTQHRDLGLLSNLRPYERWRKKENLTMTAAMQGFKSLFGSSLPSIIWLRGKGLNFVNNMPWLKYFFVRQAMGTTSYEQEDAAL